MTDTNQSARDVLANPNVMPLSKKIFLLLLIIAPLAGVGIYAALSGRPPKSNLKVVDWGLYRQLDLNSNRPTPALAAFDGQKIRSPGFMVPLEDNRSEVMEFLLVPNPQACIHAPPPPSNQMVYVRMVGAPAKTLFGPVMVEGILRLSGQTHQYGTASFQIYGENVELYQGD